MVYVATVTVVGCGSRTTTQPRKISATPSAENAVGAGRGQQCQPGDNSPKHGCHDGLQCAPTPGGYCMSFCGADDLPCNDGVCVDSARAGELCLKSCDSDGDCRSGEGYLCDPVWKACTLPNMASPRLASCAPAAKLPQGRFRDGLVVSGGSDAELADGYQLEPTAVVTDSGGVVASFISLAARGKPNGLGIVTIAADGKPQSAKPFGGSRSNHYDPWMARDRKGRIYLVWLAFDGGRAPEKNMAIELATSDDDGATWTSPRTIHDGVLDCPDAAAGCLDKPMIVIGPNRRNRSRDAVYVFYFSAHARENGQIPPGLRVVSSFDRGSSFSASQPVLSGAYGDAVVDDVGNIHVVTVHGSPRSGPFGSPDQRIEYALSRDRGTSFTKPVRVSAKTESIPFFFVSPQIVVDHKRGLTHVAYAAGTPDGKWDIRLATGNQRGWFYRTANDDAKPRDLTSDDNTVCAHHMIPSLALGDGGELHVSWAENRNGIGGMAYARCPSSAGECGQNVALSSKPFADYALVRHSRRWLGEYNALLWDASRQRLHALFTQTVSIGGKPVSRVVYTRSR